MPRCPTFPARKPAGQKRNGTQAGRVASTRRVDRGANGARAPSRRGATWRCLQSPGALECEVPAARGAVERELVVLLASHPYRSRAYTRAGTRVRQPDHRSERRVADPRPTSRGLASASMTIREVSRSHHIETTRARTSVPATPGQRRSCSCSLAASTSASRDIKIVDFPEAAWPDPRLELRTQRPVIRSVFRVPCSVLRAPCSVLLAPCSVLRVSFFVVRGSWFVVRRSSFVVRVCILSTHDAPQLTNASSQTGDTTIGQRAQRGTRPPNFDGRTPVCDKQPISSERRRNHSQT